MRVEFADDNLERLLYEADFKTRWPQGVVSKYRMRMQFILQAPDERAFREMKSFHFEALKGQRKGQHSIRLNRQYRIVFRFEGVGEDKRVVVLSIEDYH